jgi:hypothetical protein
VIHDYGIRKTRARIDVRMGGSGAPDASRTRKGPLKLEEDVRFR